ncbi:armadillo repeat-containing protein 6 homolog [Phlebotomus argentipes]|uniref:armadillo repeat-containing protein 6 homolog n=1 Tax=Phlebotomus argentipes TaxID=94469 RepID=UPI002892B04D|nr:armadillo repeat-containing protein 6 homolog [Phlebotomus argentipes]
MAKVISQETFDDTVKENVLEFEMSVEEAKEETIKQFQAQGVNLANIIVDLKVNSETGRPIVLERIEELKEIEQLTEENRKDFLEKVQVISEECSKTLPHRVLAAKNGANDALLNALKKVLDSEPRDKEVLYRILENLGILSEKQPDIFTHDCLHAAIRLLQTETDESCVRECLRWLQKVCILHEMNRQMIIEEGAVKTLKNFLATRSPVLVRELCSLFRNLVLDDDIRVEFGKAHEHARTIAESCLADLTKLLYDFKGDRDVVSDLLLTIATLTVRNEYCLLVEDAGGLKFTLSAMGEHSESLKLLREGLKLLKALAGNDAVKVKIIQQGAAPLITSLLSTHQANESLVRYALAAIAMLTLRVKENSQAFFDAGAAEVIVGCMKVHEKSKFVQRSGAHSIRNMVSRSRDQCNAFISQGAEDVLNLALKEHPSITYDVKSALRDLGVTVQLNEEWTGTAEKNITK